MVRKKWRVKTFYQLGQISLLYTNIPLADGDFIYD